MGWRFFTGSGVRDQTKIYSKKHQKLCEEHGSSYLRYKYERTKCDAKIVADEQRQRKKAAAKDGIDAFLVWAGGTPRDLSC